MQTCLILLLFFMSYYAAHATTLVLTPRGHVAEHISPFNDFFTYDVYCSGCHIYLMDQANYLKVQGGDNNFYHFKWEAVHERSHGRFPKQRSDFYFVVLNPGFKNRTLEIGYCGSCYGAYPPCCATCRDVREAYRSKGWFFSERDIEQCNIGRDISVMYSVTFENTTTLAPIQTEQPRSDTDTNASSLLYVGCTSFLALVFFIVAVVVIAVWYRNRRQTHTPAASTRPYYVQPMHYTPHVQYVEQPSQPIQTQQPYIIYPAYPMNEVRPYVMHQPCAGRSSPTYGDQLQ